MRNLYHTQVLVLVVLMLLCQTVFAQFRATGTIKDDKGQPLVGASVLIKGTTFGAFTDETGAFSVETSSNEAILLVSYVGFKTQEISLSSSNPNVNIVLESEVTSLDEVVITGYGTQSRAAATGAITQIGGEKIEQVPLASVEQALQGNIAGVQAVMSNGQPGANVSIRIRGQGSISASSEPLYVIDGIPVVSGNLTFSSQTSNPLATLNPNDIETVSVLKDAAATAIYGSRGANGVILITTKSGKAGKPQINFRTQIGANDWAVADDQQLRGLTAREYAELYVEGYRNRSGEPIETTIDRFNQQFPDPITGLPAVDINPDGSIGTVRVDNRWIDELTRTGLNQSYDLSVSGGSDNVTYFASGSYFSQEAPIIYSKLDRYSSRLNVSIRASDRLRFSNNLTVSRTFQQGANDATRWANPMYNGYLIAPVVPARDAQGLFYDGHKSFFMGGNNPIGSLSGDDSGEWTMIRILDNITGEYDIISGLTFKSAWSFDLLNYQEFYFRNSRYGDGRNDGGFGRESTRNLLNWIGTQTLNYNTTLGSNHNINALVGYEANQSGTRSVSAAAIGYPNPALRTLNNAANPDFVQSTLSEFSFNSIFGRASYNYKDKYFVSGSVRRDGSSRFGEENRYGTFWSAGVSWRADQEPFLANLGWVNDFKIRASYGITGNAGIGNYESIPTFSFSGIDYDGQPGGVPGNIGNTELTWEQSKVFNIGLDFGFANRITGIIEYFNRESDNLLLDVPISRTTGFGSLTQNFGAMENRGLELTLNVDVIASNSFTWTVGGNVTFLQNEITKLNEEFISGTKIRREGEDFQAYYLYEWAGVDPSNGDPLWYTDETMTETTNNPSQAERFLTGKTATPSSFGGVNTVLSWKGITVDAQFVFSYDLWLYDATAWVLQGDGRFTPRSQTNLVLNRWQNPGDVTDVPRFAWGNTSSSNLQNSTRWLHDGTHIRLRNLTVSYNLPTSLVSKIGLRSLRVYGRGINLWTWTRDEDLYLDPEAAFSGVINSPIPNLKTISGGIDIGL